MRILLHYRHFPVAMARFFHWALEEMGHEVISVGPYSDGYIPWGDFYFPNHKFPPSIQTLDQNTPVEVVLDTFKRHFRGKPDLILQAGDTIWLTGKADVPNFILATDPHVIDYTPRLFDADRYFYMQKNHCPKKGIWIPYAHDPNIHFPMKEENKYDVVLCGLQYEQRKMAVAQLEKAGLRVFNALGLIYEDYNRVYNQGKMAFNSSSRDDLPARFWEGLGMGRLVLTDWVPDLDEIEFKHGVDYIQYATLKQLVEYATFYASHDLERKRIADSGHKKVKPHTYIERCARILKEL